jgi:hypothetical protein
MYMPFVQIFANSKKIMKNQLLRYILKNVLSWIIIMLSMTLTWLLLVYASVVFPSKVNNWEVLNASTINNIIDNLFWKSDSSWNISYTWWNVWIWTTPSEKLDLWWGNIKMGYQWYWTINTTLSADAWWWTSRFDACIPTLNWFSSI